MKPKLSEHAARIAQVKRGLDQLSDGYFVGLPATEDPELTELFESFNRLCSTVKERDHNLRSENVQLAASVSRIETLLDASIDGVAFIGADHSFQFVNRRFCEILGLHPGALNHKSVAEAGELWQDSIKNPQRLMRVLSPVPHDNQNGTLDVVDEVIELAGAEPRYAQTYGAPVLDDNGEFSGRIISLHDNTREMELDRLKTEFISVVSHELRTPLTSIKGYTDLLISGATGEINDIQREFLGILQSSANRLGNLINDILDLSRIDAGRMEVKHIPVDYSKIVGDLARLMKAAADEKEISLDVSYPQNMPLVTGDPDKITQVVSNLLSNAIKYTPEGGWIKILVEVTGEATVRTCVADSGIGISLVDQKRLFQKFFRADNSLTREAGGTGLGLVIVKSIVELLGGAIWVQSESGRGSRFYFTLPLNVERKNLALDDAGGDVREPTQMPDRGVGLVLVVDSSSQVREAVQHSLHRRGYGIINAASAEEALQRARMHKPDVVLLDVMMDQCKGFGILESLTRDPSTSALPVLAVSMDAEVASDKITLGAVSFAPKPPDLADLAALLNQRRAIVGWPPNVLIVVFNLLGMEDAIATSADLERYDVATTIVQGPTEAVQSIVSKTPDALLIDAANVEEAALYSLLKALKSENDYAKIPVILMTNGLDGNNVHFHIGDPADEKRTAVEYLAEQVAAVLRLNSYHFVSQDSDDEGAESGILNDN